jgi:CRP-like cAMP-binding protein
MAVNVVLAGSLGFLNLGEVLQLLGSNGSSGTLRIFTPLVPQPGFIYFTEGNPVDANTGDKEGIDALYALFGWLDADFEFTAEDHGAPRTIQKSRMEIILDSLSMLDDGLIPKLGETPPEKASETPKSTPDLPVIKGPMVDYMFVLDEEEFHDGRLIVEEGKHGRWIWVILEGVVDIVKNTPDGQLPIIRISEGGFIGGVNTFQLGGGVRSASSVAVGRVQLGVLDSQRLTNEYSGLSKEMRKLASGLEKRLTHVTDAIVQIQTGKRQLKQLIKGKKSVIKQGSEEDRLFQITEGEACVLRQTEAGYIPIALLAPGDLFGHIPFLDMGHEPYSASVLGSPDLKVAKIDGAALKDEYDHLSLTMRNLIGNMATCLLATTQVAGVKLKRRKKGGQSEA